MDADVAVIGFGPVGAVAAGLLGKQGLRVLVIEKDETVFPLPRAAHVDHTGLRTVQELGCVDELLPKMIRNKRLDLVDADRRILARIPADQESVSGLPTSVYFYQPEFDTALRRAAAALPNVYVRLNTEMTGLVAQADDVVIRFRTRSGKYESARVGWVLGCDGAWSPVRDIMNIKLESMNFDEQWLVLDLRVEIPQSSLPADHVVEVCDPARPYLSTPISTNHQRFEFMLLPGENPEQMKQPRVIRNLLQSWIPADSYQVERAAVYTFHGLVAERWRDGRVFIAGDAAHQTPPFLGQGMCAGIRDAANLAWKLAYVVKRGAPCDLLDTYELERRPHAVKVINAAIRIGKVICELDQHKAAERDVLLRANNSQMRKDLSFALPRLEPSPLILKGGGSLFVQPVIYGRRFDDIVGAHFLVLARSAAALGNTVDWWADELGAYVAELQDFDDAALNHWFDRHKAEVVVVRPDRYVLGTASNLDQITNAVQTQFAGGRCRDSVGRRASRMSAISLRQPAGPAAKRR
jgi:3-(3-hydroxy-phenyl)propionate hydroxylase